MAASDTPAVDSNKHTSVIIAGAGISGLCALIQLKRVLKVTDVLVFEKDKGLGGTWYSNSYPGASCDIPIALYSYSFEPAKEFDSQWPGAAGIRKYYNRVVDKFGVRQSLVYETIVEEARFSRSTGLWTVVTRDLTTGEQTTRTANVFISAVGALSTPSDPPFDTREFTGTVVHSAKWDDSISLKDKDVVLLGNGCSAAQIVPAALPEVKSLTQIARAKHSIVAPNQIVDNAVTNGVFRWVPGLFSVFRYVVFTICESYFYLSKADAEKSIKGREQIKRESDAYIEETAPSKYWDQLKYDFEFGQKRRIIDFPGYTAAINSPKFNLLLPDTIASAKGRTVTTEKGVEVEANIIICATGFKTTEYLFPLSVYNDAGELLVERLKGNGLKTYLTSMVASYPNLFILLGPNCLTGHSSALFNVECVIEMMLRLLKPLAATLRSPSEAIKTQAPTVEVTQEAEDEWYGRMRAEMATRIWEKDGGISWYVDKGQGKCTQLFPWSQPEFQRQTRELKKERFVWTEGGEIK